MTLVVLREKEGSPNNSTATQYSFFLSCVSCVLWFKNLRGSMMKKIIVVTFMLGLLCLSAHAASFDCAKASTTLEKTICGDDQLNQADTRLGNVYAELRKSLSKPIWEGIKQDQRAWLQQREFHCLPDEAGCLLTVYAQRIRILEFRLSPNFDDSLSGRISGKYTIDDYMELRVHALSEQEIAIEIEGAEPTSARWVCYFVGEGVIDTNGVEIHAEDADQPVRFIFSENEVTVDEGEMNTGYFCGMHGTLSGVYRKK